LLALGSSKPAPTLLERLHHCPAHSRKILYYDGLQFADPKDREQGLPPTAVVGVNGETGAAKDRSAVANIDPDSALITLKEMQITAVAANYDARDVACGKIGSLAVE
jgi:hypothetical protein